MALCVTTNFTPITGWLGGDMSKFEKNEIVIYVGSGCTDGGGKSDFSYGQEIQIEEVYPARHEFTSPMGVRYWSQENTYRFGSSFIVESVLRKRRPPEQPADADFQEWFNKIISKPTEETIKRAFVNGMWSGR
jgi:hypothetical protein